MWNAGFNLQRKRNTYVKQATQRLELRISGVLLGLCTGACSISLRCLKGQKQPQSSFPEDLSLVVFRVLFKKKKKSFQRQNQKRSPPSAPMLGHLMLPWDPHEDAATFPHINAMAKGQAVEDFWSPDEGRREQRMTSPQASLMCSQRVKAPAWNWLHVYPWCGFCIRKGRPKVDQFDLEVVFAKKTWCLIWCLYAGCQHYWGHPKCWSYDKKG